MSSLTSSIDGLRVRESGPWIQRKYFFLKEGKNLRVHAQDGRLFLTRTQQRYDMILLDAYYTDAIPFHLTTREFFQTAERKLTPNGIVVANIIGAVNGPGGKITRSVVKTLRGIFPQIYLFPTRGSLGLSLDTIQNVILIATKERQRLDIREITKSVGMTSATGDGATHGNTKTA